MLGLTFLPKCPLCIAAYLASFGLSAGLAGAAAPLVRPLAVALLIAAVAVLFHSGWGRRKPRTAEAAQTNRPPDWLNHNSQAITGCCLPNPRI